jgi:hypothetical protein
LESIGLQSINQLTEFIDIERDLLVKDVTIKTIKDMESELYLFFKKNPSQKKDSKKFTLNSLKNFAKQSNMMLTYRKNDNPVIINGILYRRIVYVYTIKPI